MDAVDTSTLGRTLSNLRESLAFYSVQTSEPALRISRDSIVLAFTICWQQIRPALERAFIRVDGLDHDTVKGMSLGELMREANERGYTDIEWEHWKALREARNVSAHAYHEAIAEKILGMTPQLIEAVDGLLQRLAAKEED